MEWGLAPERYILFLGRLSPEKGCHVLIEAFEQLDAGPDMKLVLAGASSYCDDYSRSLRAHASEKIKILDWVSGDALDELLTNAMIFVLPSEMEGLSLALLDAMGAGRCVLTSDVPENREAVDGVGFTFARGNASSLADQLRFLIANPAARQAAGKEAQARVRESYQWSSIAADIEKKYFEVVGWGAPTAPKKPSARVTRIGDAVQGLSTRTGA
jgi:glycosyltransferase involved in cell wall biosynthesis